MMGNYEKFLNDCKIDFSEINGIIKNNILSIMGGTWDEYKENILQCQSDMNNAIKKFINETNIDFVLNGVFDLFQYNIFRGIMDGDCFGVFMVQLYTPYIYDYEIFAIDCDFNVVKLKFSDMIFDFLENDCIFNGMSKKYVSRETL